MNLIKDIWLPVIRKDGTKEKIAIHQLLNHYQKNPVVEIEAPRPDFRNALYQLLIGIVQVAAMPEDEEDWYDLFEEPYGHDEFSEKILKYEDCFEIDSEGPAFMQDFDLPYGEVKDISALLIEAPGGKTITDNMDHFIKRYFIRHIDAYWAVVALYTLQTFAPSGGVGHRVGLRGGGPLTTIVSLSGGMSLWKKIWLNVLCSGMVSTLAGDSQHLSKADIFPWMKPTKISDKTGSELYSNEVHPFHHFFGMPRRIRLDFIKERRTCNLTNEECEYIVKSFRTKNYGNNYEGVWTHPLNAYNQDPKKKDKPPISIKAQPGGISYRHWLALSLETDNHIPALVVRLINESTYRRDIVRKYGISLWAAGYDMDNMKARCWYESSMPLYPLESDQKNEVSNLVKVFIGQAISLTRDVRSAVKSAWYTTPSGVKGDMTFIDTGFWQNTESAFYSVLERFIHNLPDQRIKKDIIDHWGKTLQKEAESLFDSHALAQQEDGLDMKRVIKARENLVKGIKKMWKNLNTLKEEE